MVENHADLNVYIKYRQLHRTSKNTSDMTTANRGLTDKSRKIPTILNPTRWLRSAPVLLVFIVLSSNAHAQYLRPLTRSRSNNLSGWQAREEGESKNLWINSYDDFCLYGPKDATHLISQTGGNVVSYCSQDGHGTRLMQDGTLQGVTYVKTPNYIQVSGSGDFTKINVMAGDQGGQFDSSAHTPDGAQVFTSGDTPASSWVTLISANTFCVRACTGDPKFCPSQYDEMGCYFLTSNGVGWPDVWQNCQGDDGDVPGVHDGVTYTQGQGEFPEQTAPAVYSCSQGSSVHNGNGAAGSSTITSTSTSPTSSSETSAPNSNGGFVVSQVQSVNKNTSASWTGLIAASTSWVAVPTCVPCGAAATGTSSTVGALSSSSQQHSSAAQSSGTVQVGVTEVGSDLQESASVSSEHGTSTGQIPTSSSASSPSNDLLSRRQEGGGTTTSNGQCCFTTWTPTIVSPAGPTSASWISSGANVGAGSAPANGTLSMGSQPPITSLSSVSGSSNTATVSLSSGAPLSTGNTTLNGNGTKAANTTAGSSAWQEATVGNGGLNVGLLTTTILLLLSVTGGGIAML